ncbi:phosphonate ABC transporter ATP-binding protein [Microbacterium esteraromaticum]|uniref:Phosphonate ABC transporter ATP-binding protein n=1 Tax=Microbacterium esteraromaticum TaxID=57043 RepID=A0A939DYU5_9MICO|nr:phosphonate ABC transporter ATP-binding protein [Microbacterium esteraromaticum]MBN7794653.1 phosphonate ABC transporter ATP-binding protein [Microbacterium esteraromaticum]MBN8206732.1 phosphonate ABC transporter ATP-binding protein [Microbacterium esteraromaticum]MBN8416887.1 phosphonate ABC transporter ATP-binding protein [Microbacterium esteraromaticum]MBN8425514.1 phosphonate ABC transporter ATP-binding protein [Microbacterium esteraromaticum]
MSDTPAIQLTDVSKQYGSTRALDGVSLSVATGEIVVLLGLSGSGKSTLLRHLNGLEMASSGEVRVFGSPVGDARGRLLRAIRSRLGFIFQQFELVGPISVLENVLTGALATLRGPRLGLLSYPRRLRIRALELLAEVGLEHVAFQRADTLSGGQQQRVAIARALMQEPEILLADEPVASLDPESSQQVMTLIREIAERRGLTVVCSLHQVDLALAWADRIVGLRHGGVVLDLPAGGLDAQTVMQVYRQVSVDADSAALDQPGPPVVLAGTPASHDARELSEVLA